MGNSWGWAQSYIAVRKPEKPLRRPGESKTGILVDLKEEHIRQDAVGA